MNIGDWIVIGATVLTLIITVPIMIENHKTLKKFNKKRK
nr:MAG TPA: hypothetical protein [Caudoviricetes sp.]